MPGLDKEVAIMLLVLAGKYGVPAVKQIIDVWKDDTPITLDALKDYTNKFKDPSSYFEK